MSNKHHELREFEKAWLKNHHQILKDKYHSMVRDKYCSAANEAYNEVPRHIKSVRELFAYNSEKLELLKQCVREHYNEEEFLEFQQEKLHERKLMLYDRIQKAKKVRENN